ncbi:hypothetical protein H0S58_13015 [Acinetobacter sp. TTH0-4]|uniref:hypothetical protein n=1 Tax=Acinetobacter sp. TTH0-4 TaxID=1646498 RepID=UPI00189EB508|nr:hypothetical protein [Acinetobacter sp. TTH0-4]QPF37855.1 hypothetical protein H0S58_13015 [Acinetobacter sp. TTH0-4]
MVSSVKYLDHQDKINGFNARTLIILHGHGSNKSYSKFYDENWNVIIPLNEFGTENLG